MTEFENASPEQILEALREKWREIPASRQDRSFSADLLEWDDERLLGYWHECRTQVTAMNVRGWYLELYRDKFRGKSIAEIGPGIGIDGIFFSRHGAHVTFVDIVEDNLKLMRRICSLLGVEAEFYHIDDPFHFKFKQPFDALICIGSLINAPFEFMRQEVAALTKFLRVGGSVLMLGYPKERFVDSGAVDLAAFAKTTDGKRTPWAEWYDDAKTAALFGPDFQLNWSRNFGHRGLEFNWFDLTKIGPAASKGQFRPFSEPTPAAEQPYLSVVVTSRNDNHGGTLTRRMQTFVNALIAQCKRHNVPTELVIVEWNPPPDKPKLAEALHWPPDLGPCQVRILEVAPEIHNRYRWAKVMPLYQFIAKNVGIRRARGEFILATNIDILLNHPLMEFIARRGLEKGRMYRIDRHDVETLVPEDAPIDEMLEYCQTHLLRVNERDGTFPVSPDGRRLLEVVDIAAPNSGITLGSGWLEVVQVPPPHETVYRFAGEVVDVSVDAAALAVAGPAPHLVFDLEPGPRLGMRPFTWIAEQAGKEVYRLFVLGRQKISIPLNGGGEEVTLRLRCEGIQEELPNDPRPICAFVYAIQVMPDVPPAPEAASDVFPLDQGLAAGSGWYAPEQMSHGVARWMGNKSEVWLAPGPESGKRHLVLDVEPGPSMAHRPFMLTVSDEEDQEILTACVMGRQSLSVPVEISPDKLRHWKLSAPGPSLPVPGDTRILNVLLRRIELSAEPVAEAVAEDVFPRDMGLAAGRGWHAPELMAGHWVRWMDNNAEIWFAATSGERPRYLAMELEPGPSLDNQPFLLRVSDEHGRAVTTACVMGRQTISIPVETAPDKLSHWILSVDSPNLPVPNDTRILNVLMWRIELLTEASVFPAAPDEDDVFPRKMGLAAGPGWYPPERWSDGWTRWMNNHAEVWLWSGSSRGLRYLVLDLEAGPSLDYQPNSLLVRDNHGREIFTTCIVGRKVLSVPVEITPNTLTHWMISVASPNLSLPGDTRTLNLLLRRIELSAEPAIADSVSHDELFSQTSGLTAGSGWYPSEVRNGKHVRWMADHARIWITSRESGLRYLVMDLEAGPSLGHRGGVLSIQGEVGSPCLNEALMSRKRVSVPVQLTAGEVAYISLRVKGCDLPVPNDSRILNLLLTRIELLDQPCEPVPDEDVFAASAGLAAGKGWYAPEFVDGRYLRWMDNDAEVHFAAHNTGDAPSALGVVMDMYAGPSLGQLPTRLWATDAQGVQFFSTTLNGRDKVRIPLISAGGSAGYFTLHVESRNLPVATDSRRLNVLLRKAEIAPSNASPFSKPEPLRPRALKCTIDPLPPQRAKPMNCQAPRSSAVPAKLSEPMPPPSHAKVVSAVFLHNNACGDFTMMHRDHWFEVRGHAEWDAFSINLDSLLCFCAHHSGAVETVLKDPMRVYHIEHSLGSGWTPQGIEPLLRRIRTLGIPDVDWRDVGHLGVLLQRYNSPATFSPSDWGLEHDIVPETLISSQA